MCVYNHMETYNTWSLNNPYGLFIVFELILGTDSKGLLEVLAKVFNTWLLNNFSKISIFHSPK